MKNLFIGLFITIFALTSCSKLDNYDEPKETLSGKLIDVVTGEPLISEQPNGYRIRLLETSWGEGVQPEYFWGKADGTFFNKRIFKGTYEVTPVEGAFFDVEPQTVKIKGKVEVNFDVIPFLHVNVQNITRNGTEATVTYKISRHKAGPKIIDTRVFVDRNPNVGFSIMDGNLSTMEDLSQMKDEDALAKTYVHTIKGLNADKKYYIKVGARVDYGSKRYNFAKTVEI